MRPEPATYSSDGIDYAFDSLDVSRELGLAYATVSCTLARTATLGPVTNAQVWTWQLPEGGTALRLVCVAWKHGGRGNPFAARHRELVRWVRGHVARGVGEAA